VRAPTFVPEGDWPLRRYPAIAPPSTVENFVSVVGGKLTTYRRMAAATSDLVCDRLGVDAECRTATRELPGVEDPTRLDAYVERFDAGGETDEDVVS
jgi:glycerol-3-phosphate dehydrogenase